MDIRWSLTTINHYQAITICYGSRLTPFNHLLLIIITMVSTMVNPHDYQPWFMIINHHYLAMMFINHCEPLMYHGH